jgi:hypothetical protein
VLPPDTSTVVHRNLIIALAALARGLRDPCFRRSRWSHVLWDRLRRLASAGGGLR